MTSNPEDSEDWRETNQNTGQQKSTSQDRLNRATIKHWRSADKQAAWKMSRHGFVSGWGGWLTLCPAAKLQHRPWTVAELSREQLVRLCAFISVFRNTLIGTDRVREHACGSEAWRDRSSSYHLRGLFQDDSHQRGMGAGVVKGHLDFYYINILQITYYTNILQITYCTNILK